MKKTTKKPSGAPPAPTEPLVIELWPIARPIPYEKNARIVSPRAVEVLSSSIAEFGWRQPIVVDSRDVIIMGHTRLLAAKHLKLTEVPVHIARTLSPAQVKALRLMDNRSADETSWDLALVEVEMQEIVELGYDTANTGFTEKEVEALFAGGGRTDPDAVPAAPETPVSVLGDLWLLGGHRVLCGDSTDADAVSRLMSGEKADMVYTDPPYGISAVKLSRSGGTVGNAGGTPFGGGGRGSIGGAKPFGSTHGRTNKEIIKPKLYAPIIGDETTATAINSYNICVDLGVSVLIFWGGNYYANSLPPSRCWIVWDKENTGTFADGELAWTNINKPLKIFRHQWNGLIKASERNQTRVHPTQKPVALAEWTFEQFGKEAKSVLDLFLGSGSTLIACEAKSRACFGMEMSPAYCDVIVERWQAFSGKAATLEGDGRTFAEVQAERAALPQAA